MAFIAGKNTLSSGTGSWTLVVPTDTTIAIDDPGTHGVFTPGAPIPDADFATFIPSVKLVVTLTADGTTTVHIIGDPSTYNPNPVDSVGFTANMEIDVVNHTGHDLTGLTFDLANLNPALPYNLGSSVVRYGEAIFDANYAYFTRIQPVSGETITLFDPNGNPTTLAGAAPSRMVLTGDIPNGATVVSDSVVHNTELTTPPNNDFDLFITDSAGAARPSPVADIVFQNADGAAALWQVNGNTFVGGGGLGPNPGPDWSLMGQGAFYAGDTSDIVWQNQGGAVVVWQVKGTQVVGGAEVGAPGPAWHVVNSYGDFNNDGHNDLVLQNDDGTGAIWEMNGANFIGGGGIGNPGADWHIKGTGDFNADGHTDIVWQNDNGSAAIWEMNGTRFVGGGGIGNPGTDWHIKGTGDFNADGHSDIAWQNDNGSVAIWEMNGTQFIGGGGVGDPGADWHVKAINDVNKDGRSDIVLQNDNGTVGVWEMNGANFIGGGGIGNPGTSWSLVDDTMRFLYSTGAGETLTASAPAPDEFVFTSFASGEHTIDGFNPTQDVVEFSKAQFASFADVLGATRAAAGGAMIDLGNGSSLLLSGVAPTALHATNFALA